MKEIKFSKFNTPAGQKYLEKHGSKLVFIHSDHGMWRANGSGYSDHPENWGIYTLKEAYDATKHCGPKKFVRFHPVDNRHFYDTIKELSTKLAYLAEMHRIFIINSSKAKTKHR